MCISMGTIRPVSIASSSANTPGHERPLRAELSFFSPSQSLLRQRILPDLAVVAAAKCRNKVSIASSSANTPGLAKIWPGRTCHDSSQSLLRQRILPDITEPDSTKTAHRVSIASSSANTPGPITPGFRSKTNSQSQSLLRQRILPDRPAESDHRSQANGLNRFFVSEYSRTAATRGHSTTPCTV